MVKTYIRDAFETNTDLADISYLDCIKNENCESYLSACAGHDSGVQAVGGGDCKDFYCCANEWCAVHAYVSRSRIRVSERRPGWWLCSPGRHSFRALRCEQMDMACIGPEGGERGQERHSRFVPPIQLCNGDALNKVSAPGVSRGPCLPQRPLTVRIIYVFIVARS
jgi:hypothetical protein